MTVQNNKQEDKYDFEQVHQYQPKKRISNSLPLMLAATAAAGSLSACSSSEQTVASVRDEYKSISECEQDWGSISNCQPEVSSNANHSAISGHDGRVYSGRFFGPSYIEGSRQDAQRSLGVRPINGLHSDTAVGRSISRSVVRGGFGSSARGFSGGG